MSFSPKLSVCCLTFFCGLAASILADESPLCPGPLAAATAPEQSTEAGILHDSIIKANQSARSLDWVEDPDALSPCKGYYQEPYNPNPQQSLPKGKTDTFLSAGSVEGKGEDQLELKDGVEVYKGALRLSCDRMSYNRMTEEASFHGNIILRDQGFLLKAQNGRVSNNFNHLFLTDTTYLFHPQNIRGKADTLTANKTELAEKMQLTNAVISSCPPSDAGWQLSATEIELDNKKGWGSAWHAVVRIEELPVFYLPYISFPLNDQRKSGFLFPSLSVSSDNLDISAPYYLNIAPNMDMTYTPRLQTEHALAHGLEARYKNRWSEWQLSGQYIPNDKKIGFSTTENIPREQRERWAFGLKESGELNRYFYTLINYQKVSDNDYFKDWGSQGLDIRKTLNIRREALLGFHARQWQITTRLIDYQSLDPDPDLQLLYKQLPRVDITFNPLNRPFQFNPVFNSQYVTFEHEEALVEARRLHIHPGVEYHMLWPFASLTSAAFLKRTDFFLTDNGDPSDLYETTGRHEINVPVFQLDGKLHFERPGRKTTQTLSPRLFYYYAKYQDQNHLPTFDTSANTFSYEQLFRGERFNGNDRIGDANQLTLALSGHIYENLTGRTVADWGIGQILYFRDRAVAITPFDRLLRPITDDLTPDEKNYRESINTQINRQYYNGVSDLAAKATWYPSFTHAITTDTLINTALGRFEEAGVAYRYRTDNNHIFNLGYRYVREPLYRPGTAGAQPGYLEDNINEADFSVIWPLSNQFSGVFRHQYDINRREQADTIIGLTYDNCCLNIRLAYQKERKVFDDYEWEQHGYRSEYENHYMLEFTLKGLGTINSTISKLYMESIPGFRRNE